ncbi:spore coat protein [Alicyclobacillus sp. SO9]|uniref:spore coat protein n=1 Tax=Alicyclobacillus sp. SO9 TaxID=2665646 RepID=UPI001934FD3B|nr:spore coat protein [Alicyclobacillus sp. SO9]QQE77525.1 spore coat protein [Alicyclobacillus sp. SO9]
MNTESQLMQDKDLLNSILTLEKHMADEYAIAVTESNCQTVRQMFTSLLDDTLQTQNDVFHAMSQQGWYQSPAKALKQEVDKHIQTYRQTQQQLAQLVQQYRSAAMPQNTPMTTPYGTASAQSNLPNRHFQHSTGMHMNGH